MHVEYKLKLIDMFNGQFVICLYFSKDAYFLYLDDKGSLRRSSNLIAYRNVMKSL